MVARLSTLSTGELVALATVLIASISAFAGIYYKHWLSQYARRERDRADLPILREALDSASGDGWVRIEFLSRLIGTSEAATRRKLRLAGARRSLKEREVWSLASRNPRPRKDAAKRTARKAA